MRSKRSRLGTISPRRLARRLRGGNTTNLAFRAASSGAWRRGSLRIRPTAPKIYGKVGNLEVRLAQSRADIRLAQRLRYEVFYEEMSAIPSAKALMSRRDEDQYDPVCDHLLVVDHEATQYPVGYGFRRAQPKVVGTYRILRQEAAERAGGFYTQSEYNIAPLLARHGDLQFMELGRSCVLKPYRTKRSVELLWHGLWAYIREHGVDVMIGCASFPGVDPEAHAMALSFLHHNALAPEQWRARAHENLHVDMDLMPATQVNPRAALKAMPPLIKGYLRLGAFVGDGAVIDRQFGTTDILVILPVSEIDPRYFSHFGAPDEEGTRISG